LTAVTLVGFSGQFRLSGSVLHKLLYSVVILNITVMFALCVDFLPGIPMLNIVLCPRTVLCHVLPLLTSPVGTVGCGSSVD
jgi:hypothetical protein